MSSTSDQSRDRNKYILRMPDGMRDRIKAAAARNGRSMNSELLTVLRDHYPAPPPVPAAYPGVRESAATLNALRDHRAHIQRAQRAALDQSLLLQGLIDHLDVIIGDGRQA